MATEYIVLSPEGYSLGMDSFGDAIFAATGCCEHVSGAGYPSLIGAWVENTLNIEPYGDRVDSPLTIEEYADIYEYDGIGEHYRIPKKEWVAKYMTE
ncbi:hypothetical protein My1_096 [Pectobacterium phage My1]|uniref:Uncharacterized protein n=1 Tax=Pectobacterium phage My1 TaxID=1204539 RepID=J9QGR6_9CAUD|nr:hypothetical protein My1_096 [Pectobacterium phage My1]AFQ22255.1 hypothetical protein My1_096 [Pectobacterium phage My1]